MPFYESVHILIDVVVCRLEKRCFGNRCRLNTVFVAHCFEISEFLVWYCLCSVVFPNARILVQYCFDSLKYKAVIRSAKKQAWRNITLGVVRARKLAVKRYTKEG